MNWFKKSQNTIQVSSANYEQKVLHYLYELSDKTEQRNQELVNYSPNYTLIKSNLINIDFPSDPDQVIQILQQDDYSQIFQIYKQLSDIYYKLHYNDPKRNIIEQLKQEIRKISDLLDQSPFTYQDAKNSAQEIIQKSRSRLSIIKILIQQALTNIPDWNNSTVIITAGEPSSDYSLSQPNYLEPISSASITVGTQTSWGGTADFTLFTDFSDNNELTNYEIDDILEAGDTDFFTENDTQQTDYFNLISELRHPNKSNNKEQEKILILYTARPAEQRNQYLSSPNSIPANIFLTSNYSNATGMARDFDKRDIWRVRIKQKYLIQTMDSPQEKWYQVKPNKTNAIPVESIKLIDPYEE